MPRVSDKTRIDHRACRRPVRVRSVYGRAPEGWDRGVMGPGIDDDELTRRVRAAKDGDRDSWEWLVDRFSRLVWVCT